MLKDLKKNTLSHLQDKTIFEDAIWYLSSNYTSYSTTRRNRMYGTVKWSVKGRSIFTLAFLFYAKTGKRWKKKDIVKHLKKSNRREQDIIIKQ